MRTTSRASTFAVGLFIVLASIAASACSSDDDASPSTTTRSSSGTGGGAVSAEYETWCTSVQNLIDQSSPGDLSDIGTLSAFNDAVQSLTTTAPDPVLSDMQTIATATETKLEAVQTDPTATLPAEIAASADDAQDKVAIWVRENCGGVELPELDL
jgi:hypothetical protein